MTTDTPRKPMEGLAEWLRRIAGRFFSHGGFQGNAEIVDILRWASEVESRCSPDSSASPAPLPQPFEFHWLVELRPAFGGHPHFEATYYAGFTPPDSVEAAKTTDPLAAVRFARKEDAERVAKRLGHTLSCIWKATEHGFAATPLAGQPTERLQGGVDSLSCDLSSLHSSSRNSSSSLHSTGNDSEGAARASEQSARPVVTVSPMGLDAPPQFQRLLERLDGYLNSPQQYVLRQELSEALALPVSWDGADGTSHDISLDYAAQIAKWMFDTYGDVPEVDAVLAEEPKAAKVVRRVPTVAMVEAGRKAMEPEKFVSHARTIWVWQAMHDAAPPLPASTQQEELRR